MYFPATLQQALHHQQQEPVLMATLSFFSIEYSTLLNK